MNAPTYNRAAREALDTIEEIQSAMRGASDLLAPEKDLHCVSRDDVAALFRYLQQQQEQALKALSVAVFQGGAQ